LPHRHRTPDTPMPYRLPCLLASLTLLLAAALPVAAQQKVLRYAFPIAETGFDPGQINDLYSSNILAHIFDPPLTYDYLARPVKVIANTAEMPEVSADGLTWTLRIRPGIYFADDPAFKGAKRELTAADYVYSLKRHWDPKVKSPNLYLLDKKVPGMAELRAEAEKTGRFDYDREVDALRVLDRYTYRIRFSEPNPNFISDLASCNLSCALAREVVEAYGDRIMQHPVGTNAFRLVDWRRSSRMALERNPNYREHFYDPQPANGDQVRQEIAARLRGRRLPMIDRVEVYVIEENQPRFLAFLNSEHDLITGVPADFVNTTIPNGQLAPNLAARGIQIDRTTELDLAFVYFGMDNPVVGGYTPEKVALRRAIALGYDIEASILQVYRGQARRAHTTVPPGSIGADTGFVGPLAEYNPAKSRALLDTFGYVDRDGDGYREMPDGSTLVLELGSTPDGASKVGDEVWRRSMDAIGLRVEFRKAKWPELLRESRAGKLMMWGLGWTAGSPDADPFYQILYGPNKGQSNHSRFDHPEFNALFERAKVLPHGPERDALFDRMNRIFSAYAPMRPIVHRIGTSLAHPWVSGYQRHPVLREFWKFIDIDPLPQAQARK
jgi:ABC-type transport system substrate-binding protein